MDLTRDLSHAYDEGSWRVSSVRGTLRYDTGVDSGVAPANDDQQNLQSGLRTARMQSFHRGAVYVYTMLDLNGFI